MAIDNGGSAFPFVAWRSPDGMVGMGRQDGMTLRDYFAAHSLKWATGPMWMSTDPKHVAERSYQLADAMIAERAKTGER